MRCNLYLRDILVINTLSKATYSHRIALNRLIDTKSAIPVATRFASVVSHKYAVYNTYIPNAARNC